MKETEAEEMPVKEIEWVGETVAEGGADCTSREGEAGALCDAEPE